MRNGSSHGACRHGSAEAAIKLSNVSAQVLFAELFRKGTFKMWVERLMIDGNIAISQQATSAVTHAGDDYTMEYCWIYTLRDGRIAHIREYLDTYVASKIFGWDKS